MTFRFLFFGGPLDGLAVDGVDADQPGQWFDFGAIVFRDSANAKMGALFETFNPLMIAELPIPRPAVRLHVYRISDKMPGDDVEWQIHVTHVGPSDRVLSDAPSAISHWARKARGL